MRNILFKSVFIFLLCFAFVQASDAHGHRWGCRPYCGPRYYAAPRYYAPPLYYYGPRWIPGHWTCGRWGGRVWVGGYYR